MFKIIQVSSPDENSPTEKRLLWIDSEEQVKVTEIPESPKRLAIIVPMD